MLSSQGLLRNCQGPIVQRLRLSVPFLIGAECAEVWQYPGNIRVFRTQCALVDDQRVIIKGLGLRISGLRSIYFRESGLDG